MTTTPILWGHAGTAKYERFPAARRRLSPALRAAIASGLRWGVTSSSYVACDEAARDLLPVRRLLGLAQAVVFDPASTLAADLHPVPAAVEAYNAYFRSDRPTDPLEADRLSIAWRSGVSRWVGAQNHARGVSVSIAHAPQYHAVVSFAAAVVATRAAYRTYLEDSVLAAVEAMLAVRGAYQHAVLTETGTLADDVSVHWDVAARDRCLEWVFATLEQFIDAGDLDPRWRTADAVKLAARIEAGREWALCPVLADALEDAGCDYAYVLDYLRHGTAFDPAMYVFDFLAGRAG